jgi:hypothetical protein
MTRSRVVALCSAVAFAACRPTDEGIPCALLKTLGDGGVALLSEGEVPAGSDVISFGVPECAEGVCLRDANFVRQAEPQTAALGYCSRRCSVQEGCHSNSAPRPLVCREVAGSGLYCVAPGP